MLTLVEETILYLHYSKTVIISYLQEKNHLRWVHFLTKQEQLCLKESQQSNVNEYFICTWFKSCQKHSRNSQTVN